ncbi:NACHT domain-containing protein [Actinomadura rudentiformis]|uniref:NACHT domain-containing protein n=1 Tax=Actinomadura rudentiformis TaxID=359158 RepID=A0A6H9ZA21_9ACTN|nr:NACHT domain-containing protein [Actinomadura rudentiformis]KAB2352555.1 NACHT domain-containing protein [Actinomadura rudentiformis]
MTASTPRPPDPSRARTTADFVQALVSLRQWAGEPSLSRLRSLGGQTVIPDGTAIDALPKSTISHVLRQTGKVPRWDFVKAFVTACLQYSDYPAELIPVELERWRAARTALADPSTRPPASAAPPDAPAEEAAAPGTAEAPAAVAVPEAVKTWIMAQVEASDRPHDDQALELLARRVAGEADRARKGLLGGYNIAPISFGPHAGPLLPGEEGEVTDDLRSIGRYFNGLRPRRLLVVGESGAGKTVLAIELVLQLMETFRAGGAPPGGRPMVPVRLDAARWTLGTPFEPWIAGQLTQEYGLPADDAARLVRDRRVLPVVDGLDELDPAPSSGPPRRAIGLLAELNRYSDLSGRHAGAVVVTCRADRYAELAEVRAGLEDAARIHLHSLTAEQIGAYLRARWPEGHPCGEQRDSIVTMLSGPAAVHLALATPWRLLLTVTAVESGADPAELLQADPDTDPGKAAARITRRLLDAYVPAATDLTPRGAHPGAVGRSQGGGTRAPYRPEQVRTWLVHLAAHLRWQAVHAVEIDRPPPGLTAIDVVPHLLWPIGGRRRVRALHGLCCAAFAVVAMLAFWTGSAVDPPDGPGAGIGLAEGFTLALMAGWVAIATGLALSPWPSAAGGRANVPRRQRVIGGLLGGLVGAPAGVLGGLGGLWLTGGKVFGFGFAVVGGFIGGFVLGAVIGVTAAGRRGAERMTVAEAIRAEPASLMGFGLCGALTGLPPLRLAGAGPVAFTLVVTGAFAAAFALGVAFKIATGGWSTDAELAHPREALHRNPTIGLAFGLTGGVAAFLVFVMNQDLLVSVLCALTGGVTFGLAFGAIAWSRTMIGLLVAASRGLLPLRLWTFLDWACEARLLRVSGATYQFRHRELQDFLTPEPEPADAHDGSRR